MNNKTQGTIVVDGLIEGRIPDDPQFTRKLEDWVGMARQIGLPFNLEISGSSFSLLPDSEPVAVDKLGDPPEHAVRDALQQLLQALPPDAAANVFSTLRTVQYRPGEEVQSLYAARPDGSVQVETRHVDADTTPPPQPMTPGERLRAAAFVSVVVLAILGVSSLFVDWGGVFNQFLATVRPVNVEDIQIDPGPFENMLVVAGKSIQNSPRAVKLTLKRGDAFPLDAAADAALAEQPDSLARRLAVHSLVRGYIRVELFDPDGKFLHAARLRIVPLFENESAPVLVHLPQRQRVARIALRY